MQLIIDGYNLIRQSPLFRMAEAKSLEAGREALLAYLEAYRRLKHHKITVVFDGEKSFHLSLQQEKVGGITVIYSGLGEKADEVIKRLVQKDHNVVVITSDREIIDFAERHQATAILAQEFLPKLEMAYYMEVKGVAEDEEEISRPISPVKKGPSRRLSKRKKKKQKVLSKL
jgi:predicted RNA-binding protein with PIN domain